MTQKLENRRINKGISNANKKKSRGHYLKYKTRSNLEQKALSKENKDPLYDEGWLPQ